MFMLMSKVLDGVDTRYILVEIHIDAIVSHFGTINPTVMRNVYMFLLGTRSGLDICLALSNLIKAKT